MATPRSLQLNLEDPGWVHCVSRCVRRAFLAGEGYEHRRGWIERRLQYLSGVFACEIAEFICMQNHVHIILRLKPMETASWSDREVVVGWLRAFPGHWDSEAGRTDEKGGASQWRELEPLLDDALSGLPEAERVAVCLRYLEGLSQDAIAAHLQVSQATVSRRIERGLDGLRKRLAVMGVLLASCALADTCAAHACEAAPTPVIAAVPKIGLSGAGTAAGAAVEDPDYHGQRHRSARPGARSPQLRH